MAMRVLTSSFFSPPWGCWVAGAAAAVEVDGEAIAAAEADDDGGFSTKEILMNRSLASSCQRQSVAGAVVPIGKRLMMMGVLTLIASLPAIAQGSDLQQKLAAAKQAAAENQQRLHQYQWVETTQLTLKGDAKPPSKTAACTVLTERFKRP